MSDELVYLPHQLLKIHPRNLRIYYGPQEVTEMAGGLRAMARTQKSGNIQALLVVPAPDEPGYYYVVDGNLRLTAGRTLGDDCPLFKCEVVQADQAEQLLMMAATGLHYPKDPISEGRHFRRLQDEEGLTIKLIAEYTGYSTRTISNRLGALDLDDEIQDLMMKKELTSDPRLIKALKAVPDREQRIKLAHYYARRDVAIGSMVARIRTLTHRLHQMNGSEQEYLAAQAARKAQQQKRTAASQNRPGGLDDEAARLIWRLAGEFLCDGCKLTGLGAQCYLCPGPMELIDHLVELAEVRLPEAGEEVAELQGA